MVHTFLPKFPWMITISRPEKIKHRKPFELSDSIRRVVAECKKLTENRGVHSVIQMSAAGFQYTGDGDTAHCRDCGLRVFNWTADKNPFTIHSEESPTCSYVRFIKESPLGTLPSSSFSIATNQNMSTSSDEQENQCKSRKVDLKSRLNNLFEPDSLKLCRRRTFCEWPHSEALSSERMTQAGFVCCDVDDRTMCIYCDLTCEKWLPYVDNPSEVHKALSPACLYVKEKLCVTERSPIVNDNISWNNESNNISFLSRTTFAHPVPQNQSHSPVYRAAGSAPSCPVYDSRSINELIKVDTTSRKDQYNVNRFCCKDLLNNWDPDANPKFDNDRWFARWTNGKQLYGDHMYKKIQETSRRYQQCKFKFF